MPEMYQNLRRAGREGRKGREGREGQRATRGFWGLCAAGTTNQKHKQYCHYVADCFEQAIFKFG